MSTALAGTAFQILLLMNIGSFEAVLPQLSMKPSPAFPDNAAGAAAFVEWLRPQYPKGRWNPPPTRVCVAGVVPFDDKTIPQVPLDISASKPPWRLLEPFGATFHYIGDDERAKGVKQRSLKQALALCGFAAAPPAAKRQPPTP